MLEGRTVGDLINEAMRAYLARVEVRQPKSSLRISIGGVENCAPAFNRFRRRL